MAVATGVMGLSTDGGFLLSLWHIAQSILLGVAIGGLLHLYLRFVGAELLLFLVGMVVNDVTAIILIAPLLLPLMKAIGTNTATSTIVVAITANAT